MTSPPDRGPVPGEGGEPRRGARGVFLKKTDVETSVDKLSKKNVFGARKEAPLRGPGDAGPSGREVFPGLWKTGRPPPRRWGTDSRQRSESGRGARAVRARGRTIGAPEVEMRAVVQRVSQARVSVGGRTVGEIGRGLLVLAGFAPEDDDAKLRWMADKLWGLRVFPDENGRMNRSAAEVGGGLLVVSQFTLYGEVSRGRRPSFTGAAPPEVAERLYHRFVAICREGGGRVEEGEFGAMMEVELVNDGPVTILVDR